MTTRNIVAAIAVVCAAVLPGAAACTTAGRSDSARLHHSTSPAASSTTGTAPPGPVTPQTAASDTGGPEPSASDAETDGAAPTESPSSAAPADDEPIGQRAAGGFTLVVAMASGDITTKVAPISVASREPVDPPHSTAEEWNTAVWVEQSTPPSSPAAGTTYVYGHACHYHVCPFTDLKDAVVGDQISAITSAGSATYTIGRIGLSPKDADSLPSWASDSTVPNRIVLVTCAYEQGDTSTSNIVVVASLNS